MDFETVEQYVRQALNQLYRNDSFLLQHNASEWSIAHKFAEYLQQNFDSHNVDREYNRRGRDDVPKKLSNLSECANSGGVSVQQERRILPDIVIHERGNDSRNLLVIEMKLDHMGDIECDEAKLRELTRNETVFSYEFGLFVNFPTGDNFEREGTQCGWFSDGEKLDV